MVARPEGVAEVDAVKHKIIALWLHFFLKRIGSKHPDFLLTLLDDLNVSNRHKIIIKSRYIDKLKFKQIPAVKGINCELRQVMNLHKEVIDKIIKL